MENPLIHSDEATELIRHHLPCFSTCSQPLVAATGQILREPIVTDREMPPFDRVTMDGYAFRLTDIEKAPDAFHVAGIAYAGHPAPVLPDEPGMCIEIMTGAILPEGADLVIPYEWTESREDHSVCLNPPEAIRPRQCIHTRGSDAQQGAVLVESGRRIGSREAAIAASCGYTELTCAKAPRIGIVTTGDELVDPSATPLAHEIRRSNDCAIEAALKAMGLPVSARMHLLDQHAPEVLTDFAAEVDLLIITGGVSKGKRDHMPETIAHLGLPRIFHGIAQRPGKPMGFWAGEQQAVFALPGNPLSTLVCLHRYVIPGILERMGFRANDRLVQLQEDVAFKPALTCFNSVKLLPDGGAVPQSANTSGDFISIMQGDGFVELPIGQDHYAAGTWVRFIPWL
ncbi:MAG: molybdopterin molybdotransferase [Kiritimatiellia bacterium]|jgi:molybdopterin molybdotransferase